VAGHQGRTWIRLVLKKAGSRRGLIGFEAYHRPSTPCVVGPTYLAEPCGSAAGSRRDCTGSLPLRGACVSPEAMPNFMIRQGFGGSGTRPIRLFRISPAVPSGSRSAPWLHYPDRPTDALKDASFPREVPTKNRNHGCLWAAPMECPGRLGILRHPANRRDAPRNVICRKSALHRADDLPMP
jgi:hypothetical protein